MAGTSAGGGSSGELTASESGAFTEALEQAVSDLAVEVLFLFSEFTPEAQAWSEEQRGRFLEQAEGRLDAILAITHYPSEIAEGLSQDLEILGASAARNGSSLSQLLVILRISRDLLLQKAIRLESEGPSSWQNDFVAFSARLLPAVDRLTDALSTGYWTSIVRAGGDELHRLGTIAERSFLGLYEADMDGIVRYANSAFAAILGLSDVDVRGKALSDVIRPTRGSVSQLLSEPPNDISSERFSIEGHEGEPFQIEVDTVVRRTEGKIAGFGGIIRVAE